MACRGMKKTSWYLAAMILSVLLGANSAAAQAGEFGTIDGDIARDGTLAPAGRIAIPNAGDSPSIGSVGIPAGENIRDAGDDPSIGSVGIPAGEGFPTAGDNPSIGESSNIFD